ncbi:hypothetical protein [Prevotella intermedia]|uniref:hypothetical protein n=2 Tax=Prevotella intermedia TaxID=28131 RepID=UPI001180E84A|nr:hypothetical protein [Prevotella intermedia]
MPDINFAMKEKGGTGKRKCEPMERIALFLILPDKSLLFPSTLRDARTPLPLPAETGKTWNNKQ